MVSVNYVTILCYPLVGVHCGPVADLIYHPYIFLISLEIFFNFFVCILFLSKIFSSCQNIVLPKHSLLNFRCVAVDSTVISLSLSSLDACMHVLCSIAVVAWVKNMCAFEAHILARPRTCNSAIFTLLQV